MQTGVSHLLDPGPEVTHDLWSKLDEMEFYLHKMKNLTIEVIVVQYHAKLHSKWLTNSKQRGQQDISQQNSTIISSYLLAWRKTNSGEHISRKECGSKCCVRYALKKIEGCYATSNINCATGICHNCEIRNTFFLKLFINVPIQSCFTFVSNKTAHAQTAPKQHSWCDNMDAVWQQTSGMPPDPLSPPDALWCGHAEGKVLWSDTKHLPQGEHEYMTHISQ